MRKLSLLFMMTALHIHIHTDSIMIGVARSDHDFLLPLSLESWVPMDKVMLDAKKIEKCMLFNHRDESDVKALYTVIS